MTISEVKSAVVIDIVLGCGYLIVHDLAAELYLFAFMVSHQNLVRLVPASPDHQVRVFDLRGLLLRSLSLNKLDSFFLPREYIAVQLLGIASQPRIAVQDAIVFRKPLCIVVGVTSTLCLSHSVVEYPNLISKQNLNIAFSEVRRHELVQVGRELLISKLITKTVAGARALKKLGFLTRAAVLTASLTGELVRLGELCPLLEFDLVVTAVAGRPVDHGPSTAKAAVRPSNNHNFLHFLTNHLPHHFPVGRKSEEFVRKKHFLRLVFQKREPRIEAGVENLVSTIAKNDGF